MIELGFQPIIEDSYLFDNGWLLVFFYVDDIMALYHHSNEAQFFAFRIQLMGRYEIKWFLGIRIIRDRAQRTFNLYQDSYIRKIASSFHLDALTRYPDTPMTTDGLKGFIGKASPQEIYAYQRKVGSLLYTTTITRPDVARTANKLSESLQNPEPSYQAVNRNIAHLYHTRFLAVENTTTTDRPFLYASDAVYADDLVTCRSTEGYLIKLFGSVIDWNRPSRKR